MPIERVDQPTTAEARARDFGYTSALPNTSVIDKSGNVRRPDPNFIYTPPEDDRIPIDVPPGYGARYGIQDTNIFSPNVPTSARPPRYFKGDEIIPAGYPIERRIKMQQDLFDAGLLDIGYRKGEWNEDTRTAYIKALARANASGTTYDQTIAELKANIAQYGRPTDARKLAPGIIELTNPTQIANLANEVAVRTLGRRLDPIESERFASTYNQMEREYQQRIYQLRLSGADNTIAGEVTQPQSLSDFTTDIGEQLKQENPQESSAISTLNAADIFFSMLRGNA